MADYPKQDRELGLPTTTIGNRVYTKYDPNIALDIVQRLAEGELLRDITNKLAPEKTVAKETFLRWVEIVPELKEAYAAALEISAHSYEEEAIDVARKLSNAPGSPQNVSAKNTLISQLRWSASRRNPTRYSDKGNNVIVVPVQINTPLDLGGNGARRIDVENPDIYKITAPVVDAEFKEVDTVEGEVKPDFRELLKPEEAHPRPAIFGPEGKGGQRPGHTNGKRKLIARNPNWKRS